MTDRIPISIDIISDVVCPWCFLGMRRLEQALEMVPELEASIRWRPFQLDPTIPPEGRDRKQYMAAKFGSAERVAASHERLTELGRSADIAFDFDAIAVSPNTLDAHRVIDWAGEVGADVQSALVRELFSLYFERGANIGDPAVLAEAARAAGLDREVVAGRLANDTGRAKVTAEVEHAQRIGVTGVPCFIVNNRYAITGAQEAAVLADALRRIATEPPEA